MERLIAIHKEFEKTDFGQVLASRVRYERYKPADVTNERWVELLGADVNNLTHLTLTYGLAQDFIHVAEKLQPGYLNAEEAVLLQVAALIHDWAEAIVGDVTFGDKTLADETAEQVAFEAHLAEFYTGNATELINKARQEIIFDHAGESKLSQVFNAIERVGYIRTALRASEHVANADAQECEDGLRWLVVDVLSQQPIALMKYAETLQPVRQYLHNQTEAISRAFALDDDTVFDHYPPEKRQAKRLQFQQSRLAWQEWQ